MELRVSVTPFDNFLITLINILDSYLLVPENQKSVILSMSATFMPLDVISSFRVYVIFFDLLKSEYLFESAISSQFIINAQLISSV
jgi:hypothetical protein